MKGGISVTQQEELDTEEENYNHLMRELTELKDMKEQKMSEHKVIEQDAEFEESQAANDMDRLKNEKQYLVQKVTTIQKDLDDKK